MKRVLVTGGTGFIGRHAIGPLLERGYAVHVVATRKSSQAGLFAQANYHDHQVNITDAASMRSLVDEIAPTHLLHFAWFVEVGKYWLSKENFRWVEASLALLRAFEERGGKRAVMAGSCAEYDWATGLLSEERTARLPRHPYGVCKNALHDMAKSLCEQSDLSLAWGRIFFVYGPGEPPSKLVSSIVSAILRNEPAVCEQPQLRRDYLYVEDVAAAFVALLDSKVEGAVNICSGTPLSLREIATKVASFLQAEHLVEFGASPGSDPIVLVGDNRRLSQEVGWKPAFTLEHGLAKTIDWFSTKTA